MQKVLYGMIGEKVGMTRVFTDKGLSLPVTVIKLGPCYVVQEKKTEKDGYRALQLGYQEVPGKKSSKPRNGHTKKYGAPALKHLKEFTFPENQSFGPGQILKVDGFTVGDLVHVTGRSRGKGFAGVMKRHGYRGGPKTHGSMHLRAPGSIGATDAGRVFKGKGLPGRMGHEMVTIKNLEVVGVNGGRDLLLVKGAVPGSPGTLVYVRKHSG
ncbi:MAG TPA: 50S ribosomal protein L3 [Atribacteraceae bacterium]|nr:50S ribosomal protein L3 [Atribacteraceae bacterium]